MPPTLKKFLQSWLINTLAVLLAVSIVPGLHYDKFTDLMTASLLLGILNAFLRPILLLVALPLLIFTLGLFMLVINGLLLYFVGFLLQPQFTVNSFWAAFWGRAGHQPDLTPSQCPHPLRQHQRPSSAHPPPPAPFRPRRKWPCDRRLTSRARSLL